MEIPMEGDYGYCWGDDDSPLVGDSVDDRNDEGDFDPMTCSEYEAMIALGLAPICGGSPEYVQPEILPCPHCTSTNTVMDTEGFHDIVRCRGCGLRGPSATTGTDAACLWNRFARLAKDGPEQDDRVFCPTCKGSGFVLSPDEADTPSTEATPEDATSEPPDALLNDLSMVARAAPTFGSFLSRAAAEILRLQARVAELDAGNFALRNRCRRLEEEIGTICGGYEF